LGLSDRLGDLEFPDRFGDLESALLGDLESALLGDLELPDLLGDLELRRSGDRDLFDAGDASLAFRAGERSLDLELLLLGERDLLGDLLLDRPPFIFASSVNRNLFP